MNIQKTLRVEQEGDKRNRDKLILILIIFLDFVFSFSLRGES